MYFVFELKIAPKFVSGVQPRFCKRRRGAELKAKSRMSIDQQRIKQRMRSSKAAFTERPYLRICAKKYGYAYKKYGYAYKKYAYAYKILTLVGLFYIVF